MGELRSTEIHWVVSSYIGVEGGYLGDFTYRTHKEFYSAYCDLDLDPEAFPGNTTRERFIAVLKTSPALTQAAILRGIARKYPPGTEHQRTAAAYQKLLALAKQCADGLSVETVSPQISSDLLQRALADAATLMGTSGPTHAVDRVHTAMHAYLKAACRAQDIEIPPGATITSLFKLLRQQHPGLTNLGPQPDTMIKVLSSLSNVMDCLNPARNNASLAHANDELLERDEACLVINSARTIFQYLDAKLR